MAKVGMKFPVCAPIESEIKGQPIVYGEGFVMGEAISAEISLQRADARLYGDDTLQDRDNSVIGGTETLNITRLPLEVRTKMLGMEMDEETNEYIATGDASPYCGHGYFSAFREKGETKYEGIWFYKEQFSEDNFGDQTKGQQLEFNTPTIQGEIFGVEIDGTGKTRYYKKKPFATEKEAREWLKALANITDTPNGQAEE